MGQTFAFVTFNKVVTSQYFLWYFNLLPIVLPTIPRTFWLDWAGISLVISWFIAQLVWLFAAYRLEFEGQRESFTFCWLAGLVFFVINSALIVQLLRTHTRLPFIVFAKVLNFNRLR